MTMWISSLMCGLIPMMREGMGVNAELAFGIQLGGG